MGFTIIMIVALFLLGRKLKGHTWLQAICFTGMLIATIILCSYYFSWHWFIGLICACALTYGLMLLSIHSNMRTKVAQEDVERFEELIRFVSFVNKIAPMVGVNWGIDIQYELQQHSASNPLYATFTSYDFDEIRFGRECVLNGVKVMGSYYYKEITKAAGLEQEDWPYKIDGDDFTDVLCGQFGDLFTVIPTDDEDRYILRVKGGVTPVMLCRYTPS